MPFSPLEDETLPEGCCGLILGGGYPELYGARLEENEGLRREIRQKITDGHAHVLQNVVGFSICRMD